MTAASHRPGTRSAGDGALVAPDSLARFAGLLADRSRAAMCLALIDGRAWTAGELAQQAGIGRSTASEHLSQLVAAGILAQEHQGRHRYLRLASPAVARVIEDLAGVVGRPEPPTSLRSVRTVGRLAAARTCYDHIAGRLGVALLDAMTGGGLIRATDGLSLTPAGRTWFAAFAATGPLVATGPAHQGAEGSEVGGEPAQAPLLSDPFSDLPRARGSRPLLRTCLDWTERRPHLGGVLGATLLTGMLTRAWVVRSDVHRGLELTGRGLEGLTAVLDVDLSWWAACDPR